MPSYFAVFVGFLSILFLAQTVSPSVNEAREANNRSSFKKNLAKKTDRKPSLKKPKKAARSVQAKAVFCVNLRSNQVLISKNPDDQLPVASLSKLVTALVTLDHLSMDNKVRVPDHIKKIPKSVVGLKPGDTLSVHDLLHGLLIGSANDCAETLACAYPGGRGAFVTAMNKKIRSFGLTKTMFYTPSGLDRKTTDEDGEEDIDSNVSTAREIAGIAKIAFSNKTIRTISLKKHYVMTSALTESGYRVRTTNKLLRDKLPLVAGKTGFTVRAGHCLASEFSPGNEHFVIVVLGSPDHFNDTRLVYQKALKETGKLSEPIPSRQRIARNPN